MKKFRKLQAAVVKLNSCSTTDPNNFVIDLSKKPFNKNEYQLLNKSINFVPNPGRPNKKDFQNDTENFFRRILLKAHFGNENACDPDGLLHNSNSSWTPKETHHKVKMYIQGNHDPPRHNKPSLTRREIEAPKSLCERNDIIISKADKGEGVVIQDIDD